MDPCTGVLNALGQLRQMIPDRAEVRQPTVFRQERASVTTDNLEMIFVHGKAAGSSGVVARFAWVRDRAMTAFGAPFD